MSSRKSLTKIIVFILLTLLTTNVGLASDLTGHWAQQDILELAELGVFETYSDGSFRPQEAITRGDFAIKLAKTFDYQPSTRNSFADLAGHRAQNYINGLVQGGVIPQEEEAFRPDEPITRAEAVSMLLGGVQLGEVVANVASSESPFQDVELDHPHAGAIELAGSLGILPPAFSDRFHPDSHLTRGEAAVMLNSARALEVIKGSVRQVNNYFSSMTMTTLSGENHEITLTPSTIVYRNNVPSGLENILNGDRVEVIVAEEGPRFIQAQGIVTEADVLTKVSQLTGNILSPSQIKALMGGNWNQSEDALRLSLYDQLLVLGFEPMEAELIISQDWAGLQKLSQEAFFAALMETIGEIPSYPGGIPLPQLQGETSQLLQQGLANIDPNQLYSLAQDLFNR
ncbi:MAG: S-layer homology domain-containing protein [Limnochordia bacterium]|jgi:hypothetical protein